MSDETIAKIKEMVDEADAEKTTSMFLWAFKKFPDEVLLEHLFALDEERQQAFLMRFVKA
jgi:hypothetical protein